MLLLFDCLLLVRSCRHSPSDALSLGASTEPRLGEVLVSEKIHIGGGGDGLRHTNMPGLISGKLLLSAISRVFRAGGSYTRACFMGFPSVSLATSLTRASHAVSLVPSRSTSPASLTRILLLRPRSKRGDSNVYNHRRRRGGRPRGAHGSGDFAGGGLLGFGSP